jgi:hypothetical protein
LLVSLELLLVGVRTKNWPSKYFAIAYHNIDEEIPEGSRRAVHYSFILLTVAGGCASVCVELQTFSAIIYSMETERTLTMNQMSRTTRLVSWPLHQQT